MKNYFKKRISILATLMIVISQIVMSPQAAYATALNVTWNPISATSLPYQFDTVGGIATDSAGNVYVCDYSTNKIWEYSGGNWYDITCGTSFNHPSGIAVDSSGHIYVADTGSETIKAMLSPITDPAHPTGSWMNLYDYTIPNAIPLCIAVNNSIFYVGFADGSIVKYEYGGALAVPITYDSNFQSPSTIAVDSLGDVFVTDSGKHTIKELPTGSKNWEDLTLNAGASFQAPFGVAVDNNDNLYVADSSAKTIMELSKPISTSSTWNKIANVDPSYMDGICFDSSNNLYLGGEVNAGNGIVYKGSITTAPVATVPDPPTNATAIILGNRAVVEFTPSANDGGSPIIKYTVTANPGGLTSSSAGNPVMVTGLIPGKSYTFTIVAINAIGNSAAVNVTLR